MNCSTKQKPRLEGNYRAQNFVALFCNNCQKVAKSKFKEQFHCSLAFYGGLTDRDDVRCENQLGRNNGSGSGRSTDRRVGELYNLRA